MIILNEYRLTSYYAISQCAAMPAICAAAPDTFVKVGTVGLVDTNLDDAVTTSSQDKNTTTSSVLFSN